MKVPPCVYSCDTFFFQDKYKLPDNLPPAELETTLERKQELQSGGKKAAVRSWKTYYTVLYGQLIAFFKDFEGSDFMLVFVVFFFFFLFFFLSFRRYFYF